MMCVGVGIGIGGWAPVTFALSFALLEVEVVR
jgi:hypothetical protein